MAADTLKDYVFVISGEGPYKEKLVALCDAPNVLALGKFRRSLRRI